MDIAIVVAAFGLGFLAAEIGLPPLVGYLAAGFVLHGFGYETSAGIEFIADVGVLMLLFGIGLKLRLRTLARPDVFGTASLHMAMTIAVLGGVFLGLGALGLPLAADLTVQQAAIIGFALSFSSTVFAVKALEDRNETESLQGRIAIGVLVVQDIVAVVFLTLSVDEPPSWWAIPVVVAVIAARPIYGWFLDRSGHGELLVLLGFLLAVGVGAESFAQVGLKEDLGALVVGLVLAGHPRSTEFADRLLGYKDLLLVGFFLSIGLGGTPSGAALAVAAIALVLLPLKTAGFVGILTRFRLRSRTALHTSLTLSSYSEFGLIVMAIAVNQDLVATEWEAALGVIVAVSFAAAARGRARYGVYRRIGAHLGRLERHPITRDDAFIEAIECRTIVLGMGRVGAGAYDELVRRRGRAVIGIDRRDDIVAKTVAAGRRVIRGDALDRDFWERLRFGSNVELVLLAMSDHQANLEAIRRVKEFLPDARIAASARYPDEVRELQEAGVDVARNLYGEAGQGLADDASDIIDGPPRPD